jgi:multiple sugar transport system substrate-binding protein
MKKRICMAVLVIFVLSLIFSGCGNANTNTQSTQQSDNTKQETVAQESTSSNTTENTSDSGDQKFKGQKITALFMSSVYAEAAKQLVPEFEKMTGATIEIADFPYVNLHEKTLLDLSSGTGSYDVISVAHEWDGEFAPFLDELDPLIKRDNFDISDFIENVLSQTGTWNGKIYGIPHANTPYIMAYRTDLIKEIPKTWDEYVKLCKSLTNKSKGFYGVSIPGVKEQYAGLFNIRLWSMGGAWADENWKVAIDSPEARNALKISKELFNYADPAAPSWGLEESINAFLQGNAAICESWPTLGITLNGDNPEKSKIVGKWALAPFPYDKTGITLLSSWELSIPTASKNKDLAWEYIKLYASKEKLTKFYTDFAILSPRKSFWEQTDIKSSKIAQLRTALDTAIIWWRIPAATEVYNLLSIYVSEYVTGQSDIEKAIKSMKSGMEDALKKSPPPSGSKNTNK